MTSTKLDRPGVLLRAFFSVLGLCGLMAAQVSLDKPLPQDTGAAGLRLELRRLATTARMLHTTAHPDDEDGGMLTLEARRNGVSVTLLTLTRGEGGQNKVGSSLFDSLGVLRTLELLAAGRNYGVEQRFSRVADFGYSKTVDETLDKWNGHEIPLADIVRMIRTLRPDVVVARFTGTTRDGHGNHQASAVLTREAFRAAGDASRFPEQFKEGLLPWQAQKLYLGRLCWNDWHECEKDYTLKLNTGGEDADLGGSSIQFAMAGLRHQLSQGAAGWSVEPGDWWSYYKLVDSVLPPTADASGHEKSFFDGLDTSLPALALRLRNDEAKAAFLAPGLREVEQLVKRATAQPDAAAEPLLAAQVKLAELAARLEISGVSEAVKQDVLGRLRQKQAQCERASVLALGLSLEATIEATGSAPTAVSPGETFTIATHLHNGLKQLVTVSDLRPDLPPGYVVDAESAVRSLPPGADAEAKFTVRVPERTELTRPYWHRNDPQTETLNLIDEPRYVMLPFPPPPFGVSARFGLGEKKDAPGRVSATVMAPFRDEKDNARWRPLAVVPAFSVLVEPLSQVIPLTGAVRCTVKVNVTSNLAGSAPGGATLRLEVPEGWQLEPAEIAVHLASRGESQGFTFQVTPRNLREGRLHLHAVLRFGGQDYREAYTLITREDLASFHYYQAATQKLSVVDVKVPATIKIGYIMGAGDEIPTVLAQLGLDVELIPAVDLAKANLGRYGTVVLGIRAYDTQKALAAANQQLLDYVSGGGTLVVQYNASSSDFNAGKFTPYPAQLGRSRVSVENAVVTMLAPGEAVFHFPNEIAARDFDGWVQERGLNFMESWDSHYTPLLESHDPGETAQRGGMLLAKVGKGTYIYTGYAFFRQLPAGVPGAVRLFVNLLSAGHEGTN
jgi:LmbE family N-acetylglucosaminyl deacetylase